ncbi:MAG: DNA cytosine methyltransferase [Acidobacteria bacterium]|nr:DNA cytosine methyltransferase [Acidobacteriota bacterium]
MKERLTSIELCAGAGGQALGLEAARFDHLALVEIDQYCCQTLAHNRPKWRAQIHCSDLRQFDARKFRGVDLLAAGLPCPPFSIAGKQLGADDERNLFPDALRIIRECQPRAVMIENVRGILGAVFEDFRGGIKRELESLGYTADFRLLNASDFGVPQLRPRVVFVALQKQLWDEFEWPKGRKRASTVGETLYPLMSAGGWKGATRWKGRADSIAPTIVGGSKKHGGPDLGPTRARAAWKTLSVDGGKLGDAPPPKDFVGLPHLTVPMVALLQGFPADWTFVGKKTHAYRQVGNAFPPPVAAAVAKKIAKVLLAHRAAGSSLNESVA